MNERNTKGIQKLCGQFHLTHESGPYARFGSYRFALSYSDVHSTRRNSPRPVLRWNWNEKAKLLASDVDIVLLEGDVRGEERYFWIDKTGIAELKELLRKEKPGSLHVTIKSVDEKFSLKAQFFARNEKTVKELKEWFASKRIKEQYPKSDDYISGSSAPPL